MQPDEETKHRVLETYGLPIVFAPNGGQLNESVQFYAEDRAFRYSFSQEQVGMTFFEFDPKLSFIHRPSLARRFLNTRCDVTPEGASPETGRGSDPNEHFSNLPTYRELIYRQLWPGIDMVFHGNKGSMKYDVMLQPGARMADIRFIYEGADEIRIDDAGNLLIVTPFGTFMDLKPVGYQKKDHIYKPVEYRFVIRAEENGSQSVGFEMTEGEHTGCSLVDNAYQIEDINSANSPTTPGFATTLGGIQEELIIACPVMQGPLGLLGEPGPVSLPTPQITLGLESYPEPPESQGLQSEPGPYRPSGSRTHKKRKRICKSNRITDNRSLRAEHVSLDKNIKKMIRGKNIIGLGSRRIVYDLGNGYVLKVAKSKYGIKSNKKEVTICMTSPSEIKKHLGHILKHDDRFNWIIMKNYYINFRRNKENMKKFFDMKGKFKKNRIIPYEISGRDGPNYQNLRLNSNGEIIVIDYGNFQYQF
ncbi:DUF7948 domain-containing protein [Paenibacillus alginolyticus]|uniref:DUF7948 domain-containing protein n=1 Tax=Paenibacillus alginolyticus TaxID=59839 RepID=A0ABT4GF29_9BACL|nr:hypothetical protein [Paenibacillus alginolyticus]MCY9694797.1 hypothetical protein [Paenibacillus alginolyticus]MEC0145765.1 hypothetical protein [Paenibacillus alginolyticus]